MADEVSARVIAQVIINVRDDGKIEASWSNVHGLASLLEMLNSALVLYTKKSLEQGTLKM